MRFFQSILVEIPENKILEHCYGKEIGIKMTVSERIGKCPDCGCESWILLPKEGAAVREGGKPYCKCMECGYNTHL